MNRKPRSSIKKTLALILLLVCFCVTLYGMGKPHLSPFSFSLKTDYPTAAAYSANGSVLIDDGGTDMLICSPEGKLTAVADATDSTSPVSLFLSVYMYGDKIYAIGDTYYNHGSYIATESVVEYDLSGNPVQTVYTLNHAEEDRVNCVQIYYLTATADGIYLTCCENDSVWVLLLGEETREVRRWTLPETVFYAGYFPTTDECLVVGLSQHCYLINGKTGTVRVLSYDEYLETLFEQFGLTMPDMDLSDLAYSFCMPSIDTGSKDGMYRYCLVDSAENLVLRLSDGSFDTVDVSKIPYSAGMTVRTLCYWSAVGLLGVFVLCGGIWLLVKKVKPKGRITLLMIALVALISVFYTKQMTSSLESSYDESLRTQTQQMSYMISKDYGKLFDSIVKQNIPEYCADTVHSGVIRELHDTLKSLCDANTSDRSTDATCMLVGTDEQLYILVDNSYASASGLSVYMFEDWDSEWGADNPGIKTEEMAYGTIDYDSAYIYSPDNRIVGALLVSSSGGNLKYISTQQIITTTISLLALLIALYMLFSLSRTLSVDLKRRKSRAPSDTLGKSLDLAGVYAFFRAITVGMDGIIVVYVAQSLCTSVSPAWKALLLALPLTADAVGTNFGCSLTPTLSNKFDDRLLSLFSSAMSLAAMLLAAYAVRAQSIYLYICAKFLLGMFVGGVQYSLVQTLCQVAPDEQTSHTVLDSIGASVSAAGVVSALLGGYASKYLSYKGIYIVGAVLCLVLAVLSLFCFVRHTDWKTENKLPDNKKAYRTLFLKKPMNFYLLCYRLPFVLFLGYQSYLLPLFTSNAGIDALLLSNITVFVSAFAYMLEGAAFSTVYKLSERKQMFVPQLIICGCLVLFLMSPTVYWAFAVLFIYSLLAYTSERSRVGFETTVAQQNGLDPKRVTAMSASWFARVNMAGSPILSAVVSVSANYACAIVGAGCAALIGIFALVTRKSPGAAPQQPDGAATESEP